MELYVVCEAIFVIHIKMLYKMIICKAPLSVVSTEDGAHVGLYMAYVVCKLS